ncbi:MAG: ADP-ribosylglycohydrolase family protein [Pseudomonadota bacterium]
MVLGLAVGDAIGTTVEFKPRGSFPPVTDMVGGGPFGLAPGQWTDDTSMAICLGESLVARAAWDPADCMNRFVNWHDHGYASCTGKCFDIGITTSAALTRYLATGDPYAGSTDPDTSGNGGIMRLAPAVVAHAGSPDGAIDQSRTTHASAECLDFAKNMARLLLSGDLHSAEAALPPATPESEIRSSGYVRHTYEAAVWCVANTGTFETAVLKAANLGDDADTVAAVTGQIAGRIHGLAGIPGPWLDRVAWRDELLSLSDKLFALELG